MNIRACCFWFVFFAYLTSVFPQSHIAKVRRFGIEDGLLNREVNCAIQDRKGFIWVGTSGGVARFDGYNFLNFYKGEAGLSTDYIRWLIDDADGNIWAMSSGQLPIVTSIDIINPSTQKIVSAAAFFGKNLPIPVENFFGKPLKFAESSTGNEGHSLILGCQKPAGFAIYHPKKAWRTVHLPQGVLFQVLKVTKQQTILGFWAKGVSTASILVEVDMSGKVLREFSDRTDQYIHDPEIGGFLSSATYWVTEDIGNDSTQIVWEVKSEGTWIISSQSDTKFIKLLGGHRVDKNRIVDSNGKVLFDFNEKYPEISHISFLQILPERTANGNYWFCHPFGLYLLQLRPNQFKRYLYQEKTEQGRGITCRGIAATNDKIFVNTENEPDAFFVIDRKTEKHSKLKAGPSYAIGENLTGGFWVDNRQETGGWLSTLDPASGRLLRVLNKESFDYAFSIFQDRPDRVLYGGQLGLTIFNPLSGSTRLVSSPLFPDFEQSYIHWIRPDRSGDIWICASNGLYLFDKNETISKRFWEDGKGDFFLPAKDFLHFYEDSNGIFWLATRGSGLLRWDRKTGQCETIAQKNGLLDKTIYAVYEDDFGHLWLPTNFGIAQFDKKNKQVSHTWLPADGIAQLEFNRISHLQEADGTLIFGGLNGLTVFNPKDFYKHDQFGNSRSLVFSRIKKSSPTQNDIQLAIRDTIELEPGDRFLHIEFALLDFFNPSRTIYVWTFAADDSDWHFQAEPFLRFPNLNYGTHRLRIRAKARDGNWAENELTMIIHAHAPFYLRWWFVMAVIVLSVWAMFAFFQQRTREHRRMAVTLRREVLKQTSTIRQQSEELREMAASQSRGFFNITHEFRTPITVISGMLDHALNELDKPIPQPKQLKADLTIVRANSNTLLDLVNQLLDLAKARANALQMNKIQSDARGYLAYLTNSFESIAQQRGITLLFEGSSDPILMDYDPEKLRQIFTNLLSNALKHTEKGGKIEVRVYQDLTNLVLQVTDTGTGIAAEDLPKIFNRFFQSQDSAMTRGSGLGLALVQELVKLLGGSVLAKSELGKGSSFEVRLPITHEAPFEALALGASPQHENLVEKNDTPDAANTLPTVLVVEDNPDVATYILRCLEGQFNLKLAENGRIGIEYALETLPDLIVSDLMMPETDGLELCRTLKNHELTSHIPIILLTARADLESRLAGLQQGADVYLAKPFDADELSMNLKNLLENRKKLQAHYQKQMLSGGESKFPNVPTGQKWTTETAASLNELFLSKINRYLESNLDNAQLSLDDISKKAGMSRTHLNRKMSALIGMSSMQYLRTIRLERAKEMLDDPDLSIAQVAYSTGFDDPKYFARVFSDAFGMPPSEYKNR